MKKSRTSRLKVFDIVNYLLLVILCVTILFPFWRIIVLSFSGGEEVKNIGLHLLPKRFTASSYIYMFNNPELQYGYANTIFRTIVGTLLTIILSLFAAYPLSNKKLFMRNYITAFFLITMFFGGGLIPSYLNIKNLGLIDSRLVYILPGAVGAYNVIIMRNFLMSIDKEIEESAQIMGAGYLTILFRIIVPISMPVIATVALWSAVGHWNSWFDALLYVNDEKKVVLQLIIRRMLVSLDQAMKQDLLAFSNINDLENPVEPATVRAATTVLTIGPIILTYPFLQKYFVKGIMTGSLKG